MRRINWVDKIVDLLVVIIGISIAFWLNNWNSEKEDRRLEQKYLESLRYDLDSDIRDLTGMIDTLEFFASQNKVFLKNIEDRTLTTDSISQYIYGLIAVSEFHKNDNAYNTLISSGNFRLISDFELEKQITVLYNQYYKHAEMIDEVHSETVMKELNPYLSEHVFIALIDEVENVDFVYNTYFLNKAYMIDYLMSTKIAIYKQCLSTAVKLREQLD